MAAKNKLELTWIGKDIRPRLEPRILIEEPELSYHAKARREGDIFDNLLVQGDNLLALKALEADPAVRGRVKCIYIDPPFNTGAAFEHYEDGLDHSIWLGLMKERIELLKALLSEDGVLWIHIDDKEMAYLRVMCDEVMGRSNFLNMIVVKTSDPSGHKTVNPSPYSQTEYILMYAKDRRFYRYEQRYVETSYDPGYNKFITNRGDHYSKWNVVGLNEFIANKLGCENTKEARKRFGRVGFDAQVAQFALENADSVFQPTAISKDAGRGIVELRDKSSGIPDQVMVYHRDNYDDVYILNGRQVYFYSSKLRIVEGEMVPAKPLTNLWTDIPYNGIAREGGVTFKNGKKPERLVARCIELTTEPGDLVLDSFAGSGTTGAVAHKMGRRWIMVELGDHAKTHIVPRLQKVIDGSDRGGVTEGMGWNGGGGYRFARLAPSLLEKDAWGNWVMRKEYNPAMLAEAMCKHFNYTYAPSTENFWMHGHSSETSYIYVTTNSLTGEQLRALSDEVGEHRSLLICCKAFEEQSALALGNLTIRKIPGAVLDRCEWGQDDYSLKIESLPMMQDDEDDDVPSAPQRMVKRDAATADLFADKAEV
ncbi:site-specific DNA-methyltransferase [Brucella anthropi]|uniref:site-specific DNA-methyltransferase n=1 Tax=Brucella anthropi TaxID=529 RepID=UPI00366EB720